MREEGASRRRDNGAMTRCVGACMLSLAIAGCALRGPSVMHGTCSSVREGRGVAGRGIPTRVWERGVTLKELRGRVRGPLGPLPGAVIEVYRGCLGPHIRERDTEGLVVSCHLGGDARFAFHVEDGEYELWVGSVDVSEAWEVTRACVKIVRDDPDAPDKDLSIWVDVRT